MQIEDIEKMLDKMIILQRKKLFKIAQELGLNLSEDDILNPYDFPILNQSSRFHYEDGVLAGLLSVQMALRNIAV